MSENLVKVIDWLDKEGTPFIGYESEDRTIWAEDLELPEESNTAIFSGCMGSFWFPDQPELVVDMLQKTSTTYAAWTILEANCKRHARIKALRTVAEALEVALEKRG